MWHEIMSCNLTQNNACDMKWWCNLTQNNATQNNACDMK